MAGCARGCSFFFSSRRRHTRSLCDWSSDVCSSDLLQATIPVFGMLLAHPYLPGERLNARRLAGALLGVGGVGLIFSHQLGSEGPMAAWGSAAVLAGAVFGAGGDALGEGRGAEVDPAVLSG